MVHNAQLNTFAAKNRLNGKGPLCVALIVTRHAKEIGLPLDATSLLTKGGGQVLGLGKAGVQKILGHHGISQVLAEEGGRTSRGSVGLMKKYVSFLNNLAKKGPVDIDGIENWWIDRVKKFFSGKPFVFRIDASKSLRTAIKALLMQAEKRQKKASGATILGTILQHLVGAKLNLLLDSPIESHGASVADEPSDRPSDFLIEDVAVHVTTSPSEALMRKCGKNLDGGLRPLIITTKDRMAIAEGLAVQAGIYDRIDIFDAEQFLAGNLYEIGRFAQSGRRTTAKELICEYNKIITKCETDPSLMIKFT